MELKVYSVKDAKAEVFNQPFMAMTPGQAERQFETLCNDEKSFVNKYPKDYDLYYLGTWDDSTGKYKPLDAPQHVVDAVSLVRQSH